MKGPILLEHQFLLGSEVRLEKGDLPGWRRLIGKLKNVLEEESK